MYTESADTDLFTIKLSWEYYNQIVNSIIKYRNVTQLIRY